MSLLIVGAGGMLGRAFCQQLTEAGRSHVATTRATYDLRDPDAPIPDDTSGVLNCAAYTNVDGAQTDEATATEVNGHAVARLVERCDARGIPLVHYSTDYVFDGRADAPYTIDHPTSPVNAYGRSKLVGEEAVRASSGPHLLLRTSWVYAPWGTNFVRTMARLTKDKDTLSVVDDQRGRPTSAPHLARSTLGLLDAGATGTFHVTDGGECTWFELASFVGSRVDPSCKIAPCTSEAFPRLAPRPAYSVLDVSQTEAVVGALTLWKDAVRATLDQMG
ncbi:MAG: dTDP-4-dehydrorhamnose reductase [Sandaracinaceae bacterium]